MITFAATGTFANQVWTKLDLPANFTNLHGNATHIIQNGANVTFVDKFGGTSPGVWVSPTQLSAWGPTVTIGKGKLTWSDGSIWFENLTLTGLGNGVPTAIVTSVPSEFTVVDYKNGVGNTVHVIKTGTSRVIFVDSLGRFSLGSFFNLTQAFSDLYPNDAATFSGTQVTWQDGAIWTITNSPANFVTLTDYTNPNGVTTHSLQNGTNQLVFSDSNGELSLATFFNATQAQGSRYPGIVATIGATTVSWSDGTVWTKVATPPPPLLITSSNPAGGASRLSILTNVTLIGLDGPRQGLSVVRLNGKLFWSNGDIWSNFDFGGLNAFFLMGTGIS